MRRGPGERALLVAVWAFQLAILLVVAAHHEPWRDEADVWLFARDAEPSAWLSFLKHSGTPGLWHLLVAPLARAGLPYASINFLNVAIVSIGVAIFLRFAPLPIVWKLLIPFGVLPLHEYGVVARSYGLSFTLVMAICAALAARRPRPLLTGLLIALLANTNAHSLVLATGLGLYWLLETWRARTPGGLAVSRAMAFGMALAMAGGSFAIWILLPPDDPQLIEREFRIDRVLLSLLRDAFFPSFSRLPGGLLGAVSLVWIVLLLRPRREVFAFLLWSAAALITFFLSVYSGFLRHAGFLWLATTAAVWLEESDASRRVPRRAVLLLLFAFSALSHLKSGVNRSGLDYDAPFSSAFEAAAFLRSFDLDAALVAAHPATTGEAVLPYLPIDALYYPGLESFGSHLPWNGAYVRGLVTKAPEAFLHTRARFPEPQPIVFITSDPIDDPAALGLVLRHRTAPAHDDFKQEEQYSIYTAGDVPGAASIER
jgi:succinate dehydrogenase hydrophobic anchor subunit